ncbi:MAG TPA: helix-turn-helix domain-containing protein [Pyrinomonadaceae bacterium]|nr:helix-turn-helix domain-containing protein [Pyrinomonadaceae bacterium]
MLLTRAPHPVLRPFVRTVWAIDALDPSAPCAERERVLPTGLMHLVFRLSDVPLRLFDNISDFTGHSLGFTMVGGARSSSYIRDTSVPSASVGALLNPGASEPLFGVTSDELAERHTPLDELWGGLAAEVRERLLEAESLNHQLGLFENLLMTRLPRVQGLHPAVADALEQFTRTSSVQEVVKRTGYSHRRFIELFTKAVGITPKLYTRVQRFQRVIELAAFRPSASMLDLALEAGYSDQPHFTRQFKEFSGMAPGEYLRLAPSSPNHLPLR